MTARDIAKWLIRPYVERGDSLQSLVDGGMGRYSQGNAAQIGGLLLTAGAPVKKVSTRQIGVSRVDGVECCAVFDLETLYQEIQAEMAGTYQTRLEV